MKDCVLKRIQIPSLKPISRCE